MADKKPTAEEVMHQPLAPTLARAALKYLDRAHLTGDEVPEFVHVQLALRKVIEEAESPITYAPQAK